MTNNESRPVKFYIRVFNLSNTPFSNNELNLNRELGLKYCPDLENRKDLQLLAINTELALNNIEDKEVKDLENINCASIITKAKHVLSLTIKPWSQ